MKDFVLKILVEMHFLCHLSALLNLMNLKLYFLYSSNVILEDIFPGWLQSGVESTMLTGLGVIGQSWDAYSDMGLAYQLATGTYKPACVRYGPPPETACLSSKS